MARNNNNEKKHARHRWRFRERDRDGERERLNGWVKEWIPKKKHCEKIKRKRKCARGFLCASSLYNIIYALSWCSAFLYSSLLSAACNGLKIQESRETNRNSRSPNEKGQTLEEKANKHPTNQRHIQMKNKKPMHETNENKRTSEPTKRTEKKEEEKIKIKWIYAYARIEMKQHTNQNKHWVKGIEVQSTFYAQWHWAVVSIVSLIWCGSFNVLAIVETGATHSFSFSYWSIKFIFMCFLHLLVYMLTFLYIHSRWYWGSFVCVIFFFNTKPNT